MSQPNRRHTLICLTSCPEPWGGSEELWAGAARVLRGRGWRVAAGRSEPAPYASHPRWRELAAAGVLTGAADVPSAIRVLPEGMAKVLTGVGPAVLGWRDQWLARRLRALRPDLVLVSMGQAYDGIRYVDLPGLCRLAGVRYVLLAHKAAEHQWPVDRDRERCRNAYLGAHACCFVSEHSRRLVTRQLGITLPHATVVRNPCLMGRTALPWPAGTDGTIRLALIGRLWPEEKGQDLLLEVLARPEWRARPIEVSCYGEGPMGAGLQAMRDALELTNVHFRGVTDDIAGIWRSHHALVLPSRAEGMPLVVVEAMLAGRPVIATAIGGIPELVRDGIDGFLAASPTADAVADALRRAWDARAQWPGMGEAAAAHARACIPADPCAVFADQLTALVTRRAVGEADA